MSKFLKKHWDKMTTNIVKSFNAWLKEEHHQTIYMLLLMHMDKLIHVRQPYVWYRKVEKHSWPENIEEANVKYHEVWSD